MEKSLIKPERFEEILNSFQKIKPIMITGDVGIDKYTFGEVNRISPEAPVPILEVKKEWLKLGLAANISHNLTTLGIPSILCTVIGEDKNGKIFEELLENEGLKTWGVIKTEDRSTTYKERITTKTQQICRVDYETKGFITDKVSNDLIDRVEDLKADCHALIIEDYAKGTLSEKAIQKLIKSFKAENKIVAIDPGRSIPAIYYKGAHLLKPNLLEAREMVKSLGHTDLSLEDMAALLVDKLELEKLVITLGGEGMALVDTKAGGKLIHIPTVSNEVFDVSGAGDTVISLLTASLVQGASLVEAAWIANCGAGVVVAKKGTATVNCEELKNFYYNRIANIKE